MKTHDSTCPAGRRRFKPLWLLAFLAWPTEALAHGSIAIGDFYAGLIHPVSHTEQALAVLAAGLLIGQMTAGLAWPAARAFFASVLAGSVLGLLDLGLPWYAVVVTLSLVMLGSLVALQARLPAKLASAVCLFFGLAVGYANGAQMLENLKMPIFYLGGLMVCVGLMLLYSSQVVRRFRAPWSQVGVRVVGSWIAAAGVLMLAIQLK